MKSIVTNKSEFLKVISNHRDEIKSFGVKNLSLFGSFAKQTEHLKSDIDILVVFKDGLKTFDNFMNLSFYLEEIVGRKVDIVTPESLSKYIGPYILKEVENVSLEH